MHKGVYVFFLKVHVITGSELTESSLPDIIIAGFILFLHFCVSTEVYNSPINRQENMIPVPVSLHSKMGFLVSTNSFPFLGLIIKNNYKDLYKLCVLPPANTNKMYHYLGFFLNPFSTVWPSPLCPPQQHTWNTSYPNELNTLNSQAQPVTAEH